MARTGPALATCRRGLPPSDGLLYGNPGQLATQGVAVLATIGYSAVMTFVILKVLDLFVGLRVADEEEVLGLDVSQHREAAYTI